MQDLIMQGTEFIKALIPVRTEIIVGTGVSIMGTVINHVLGGYDELLEALLILMVLDYITGIMAAWIMPNVKLDSHIGWKGIGKKVVILCAVSAGYLFGHITGQEAVRDVVIWFYVGNEGLSILENITNCGVPVPTKLKDNLAQYALEKIEHRRKN